MFKIFTSFTVIGVLVLSVFMISCEDNDGTIDPEVLANSPCYNEYRGDIFLDGIPFTVADFMKYVDYLLVKPDTLVPYYDLIILNSDINGDGEGLTLPDLILLIKVIIGDASPVCPKPLKIKHYDYWVEYDYLSVDGELGALYVEFDRVTDVELLDSYMEMKRNADRVVIYSLEGNSFSGRILSFNAEIIKIEAATDEGDPVIFRKYIKIEES